MMDSTFFLERARDALALAMRRDGNRPFYLTMARVELRKAIGAANHERNRRRSGQALFALTALSTAN